VPLIISSSDADEEAFSHHRRLKHPRAEDHVHKPITFEELLARIRALVNLPADDDVERRAAQDAFDAFDRLEEGVDGELMALRLSLTRAQTMGRQREERCAQRGALSVGEAGGPLQRRGRHL
jgi:DNA-binding response OmpR family regulator